MTSPSSVDHYNQILLQISCILSIIGSLTVMSICYTKRMIEKQKGKYLIFWLSFSDFASSLIYLISSFSLTETDQEKNSKKCQILALLGIFFPVASFLWTDFIAYYLYSMIVSRKFKTDLEWKQLLKSFHLISWGVSGVCILIVGIFQHAGRSIHNGSGSGDDDDGGDGPHGGDNTGGWCWVAASSSQSLLVWEIIGGKFIEWISAFLILPYFYFVTARTLINLDRSWSHMVDDRRRVTRATKTLRGGDLWETLTSTTSSLRYSIQMYFYPDSVTGGGGGGEGGQAPLLHERENDDEEPFEGDGNESCSTHPSQSPQSSEHPLETSHRDLKHQRGEEAHTPKFRKFYAKMVSAPSPSSLILLGSCSNFIFYCPNLGIHENHYLRH
jgi:hypothetical protein